MFIRHRGWYKGKKLRKWEYGPFLPSYPPAFLLFCSRLHPEPERIQPDEAFRILLIVYRVRLEGGEFGAVERHEGFAAYGVAVSLVELDPRRARHVLLRFVHHRLEHDPLGGEPVAVIDQLGVARDQTIAQVHGLAVHGDGLDGPVGGMEERAARRLVDAPGLHADVAVFDEVDAADAVPAGDPVRLG